MHLFRRTKKAKDKGKEKPPSEPAAEGNAKARPNVRNEDTLAGDLLLRPKFW
jgi:hypothetical protein